MVKKFEFFAGFALLLLAGAIADAQSLTLTDVQTIISQAVSKATALNQKVTVSVTDKEGNLLGTFAMTNATASTRIVGFGTVGQGLEGLVVPSAAASWSKAGTAAILSSGGNAFSTRTAAFIIQKHIPAGIDNTPGGPLFGVQFSTLPCSDVSIGGGLPLALSGDSGGLALYKNGVAVGGIGVEGEVFFPNAVPPTGIYTVDTDPRDNDQAVEELIAAFGSKGFEAPALIRADNILVAGLRFPYSNVTDAGSATIIPFATLSGTAVAPLRATPTSDFVPATLNGVSGQMSTRFPIVAGAALSVAEVTQILGSAAATANITRAGIRQPIGSNARVNMSVVDTTGKILGIFRQFDAPVFGFDVSVQKARTVNFFSRTDAGAKLTAAGFGSYTSRAAADGIALNGAIAFSDRGFGFLNRPLFPDGINGTAAGPFSRPEADFSPFNNGLQIDLIKLSLTGPMCRTPAMVKWENAAPCPCTAFPELKNGIQIFAGGIPLYRGSTLVGAIGISGDGIEQDDLIAAGGANNFAPPEAMRSDQFFVRGVRLPFVKFPPRPFLP